MESRVIQLTAGAIKNEKLNIRACGPSFFPPDVYGRSARDAGTGIPITLKVKGLTHTIKTDIPTNLNSGRPRWIFRKRSWVKDFVRANRLIPGDTVMLRRIAKRTYKLIPKRRKLKFIDLFAGIGGTRLAFEKAGCECVFSSEWDKFAQQTYEANFSENIIKITPCGAG